MIKNGMVKIFYGLQEIGGAEILFDELNEKINKENIFYLVFSKSL